MIEHYYESSVFDPDPNLTFGRVLKEAVDRAPDDAPFHYVHVGVGKGRAVAFVAVEALTRGKDFVIHAVDPDLDADGFNLFQANLKPVTDIMGKKFKIYKLSSHNASSKMRATPADFVFLTGDGTAEQIAGRVKDWLPRLKVGGVMAGDQWRRWEVRLGVNHHIHGRFLQLDRTMLHPWWRYFKQETA